MNHQCDVNITSLHHIFCQFDVKYRERKKGLVDSGALKLKGVTKKTKHLTFPSIKPIVFNISL